VDVKAIPGLEHLPYAEVWFHAVDDRTFRDASAAARAIGKTGLEVWTTDRTPEVVALLEPRGYVEVRRYIISELDLATAPDPEPPRHELTTLAEHPDLAEQLYAIALESYPDQPGRADSVISPYEGWRGWSIEPHPADAFFIALEDGEPTGYGYLEVEHTKGTHGFMAIARAARGRGIATSIKRAQIAWAKANGLATLRTATETRLTQMRALNARHGYKPLYEEIVLRGPAA
jgi:GNAT superfamily N-acetyltransferase